MPFLNSFWGAQPPKTRINKGFLNGGGGGLNGLLSLTEKPRSARLNECYGIHKNNKFLVQNAQNLNLNNKVFLSKFAFGCIKSFKNKLAFTYNNLIKKLQGVFRNADFSFYLRL